MIVSDIPINILDCLGDISDVIKPDQGLTSEVVIVVCEGKRFILKHSTGKFAANLRSEHQVLLALEQTPVPAARVHHFIDLQTDDTGDCWLLVDYIPGKQLTPQLSNPDLMTPEDRYQLYRSCGAALAVVHAVPPPSCLNNCSNTWLDKLISSAHKEQEVYALRFDKDVRETQSRRENLLKLEQNRPLVERFTLIHGDCGPSNMLLTENDVTLIDWGSAAVGDPCYDIAQVLWVDPDWAISKTNDHVAAFFEGYGTPPVPVEIIRYYQDLYEMGGSGCVQAMHLMPEGSDRVLFLPPWA